MDEWGYPELANGVGAAISLCQFKDIFKGLSHNSISDYRNDYLDLR